MEPRPRPAGRPVLWSGRTEHLPPELGGVAECDALFHAMNVCGDPPTRPRDYDRLLRDTLATRPCLRFYVEAQNASVKALECLHILVERPQHPHRHRAAGGGNTKPAHQHSPRPVLPHSVLATPSTPVDAVDEAQFYLPSSRESQTGHAGGAVVVLVGLEYAIRGQENGDRHAPMRVAALRRDGDERRPAARRTALMPLTELSGRP